MSLVNRQVGDQTFSALARMLFERCVSGGFAKGHSGVTRGRNCSNALRHAASYCLPEVAQTGLP
jgi:hypothetical protein